MSSFWQLLIRDLVLAFRRRSEIANPLLFYVMVVVLFPLGLGSDVELLRTVAPGVLWVAALLAALLSLDSIFRSDFEDGSLEQLLLSRTSAPVLVLAKVTAHWLVTGLPLLLMAPLLGSFLGLEGAVLLVLLISLALGTPLLSLIGAIAVALTVALRRGGMILSLLVLPLYIPVLIFGAGCVDLAASGLPVTGHYSILGGLLLGGLALAPLAAAGALKVSLS